MASTIYTPLRIHTEYSMTESVIRLPSLIEFAVSNGFSALGISDIDNVFAALKFAEACKAAGIQPIMGADISLREDSGAPVTTLPLIARDEHGFRNLCEILTTGQKTRKDQPPRVSAETIADHADGLIALSGAAGGGIGQALARDDIDAARAQAKTWQSIFGDRFYFEIQRRNQANADIVHPTIALANELSLPVIATSPSVFLQPEDIEPHATRVAIARGLTINQASDLEFTDDDRLPTHDEMAARFADIPGALENSLELAQRCAFAPAPRAPMLPDFPDAQKTGQTEANLLRQRAQEGLNQRIETLVQANPKSSPQDYRDRLTRELDVIESMGFPGYFLIVSDFIQWSKENDVPVGPGRGSGAGSLVALALSITNLDPLRYDLLFERFLNPERVSMPDFDIDFCMDKRDRVIDYVTQKYGDERVSRIITYGRMSARAVIRDVGRTMGQPYGYMDRLAKAIPGEPGTTLDEALDTAPKLGAILEEDATARAIFERARELEGLARNTGKHAGGVIIAPRPMSYFTASYYDDGEAATQFDMGDAEQVGLVKFDFLGLRTLTIIDHALKSIRANELPSFDIDTIPLDDPETFELLKSAETTSVFQLESRGMKQLIQRLQPETFEDVIALVALFRPGPLESGMVDDFVDRKHGLTSVEYPHPDLETILKPTYGVILYQEQVMQIAQTLAGYSLGDADLLRRAMGKKKPEEMAKQRQIFMAGAKARDVDPAVAGHIFDLMEKFAGYGFNKSHSAAYALIAYQTAFLKQHYPAAFMAATLSADMGNTDKLSIAINEVKRMGMAALPPDINASEKHFTPTQTGPTHRSGSSNTAPNAVRYGLGAIKGVGGNLARKIPLERERGAYRDLFDFATRSGKSVNKRSLSRLVAAGALDSIADQVNINTHKGDKTIGNRAQLTAEIPDAIKGSDQINRSQARGQADMFGFEPEASTQTQSREITAPWGEQSRLEHEFTALGLYLSGHPFEPYIEKMAGRTSGTIAEVLADFEANPPTDAYGTPRIVAGTVMARRDIKGHAFVQIEDGTGALETPIFAETCAEYGHLATVGSPVVITGNGSVDNFSGGFRVVADSILTPEQAQTLIPRDNIQLKAVPATTQQAGPAFSDTAPPSQMQPTDRVYEAEEAEADEDYDWPATLPGII